MIVTMRHLTEEEKERERLWQREEYDRVMKAQYDSGYEIGEKRHAALISKLIADNRMSLIEEVLSNDELKEQLYTEYGL